MDGVDTASDADAPARHAIEQLKYRYWRACDAKDPEGFRACFVRSGGVLDYGPLGRTDPDAMVELFRRIALATAPDGGPRVLDMHHGFMPSIELTGPGRATGRWTLHFRQVDRVAGTETVSTGEYDDVYVLEDGRWVMAECLFTPGWSITRPLGEATVRPGEETP